MSDAGADLDLDALELEEMLALRGRLAESLERRFEREVALAFSDVVGSTATFAELGDAAGGALLSRHRDLVAQAVDGARGVVVDTAGDGALLCFDSADRCVEALVDLERSIEAHNQRRVGAHRLRVRCGVHFGQALTDGVMVTGEAVNVCARVTTAAGAGEIRLTRAAADRLAPAMRARCQPLPPQALRGVARPVEMLLLRWRETSARPRRLRLEESGEVFAIPDQAVVSIGRLREHAGSRANDIVIDLPDRNQLIKISRWHVELREEGDAMVVVPVSNESTELDGRKLEKGRRERVTCGSALRLSGAVTLTFLDGDDVAR